LHYVRAQRWLHGLEHNLRSRCQRKAWGEAKRNPRIEDHKKEKAREAGDSPRDKEFQIAY